MLRSKLLRDDATAQVYYHGQVYRVIFKDGNGRGDYARSTDGQWQYLVDDFPVNGEDVEPEVAEELEKLTQAVRPQNALKSFWVSWYQPTDDYRPLPVPPKSIVKGYWCTGCRDADAASTMVAWVRAEDAACAMARIKEYWPEAAEWRFCDERAEGWQPNERFPR